jgi:hypothetical protein
LERKIEIEKVEIDSATKKAGTIAHSSLVSIFRFLVFSTRIQPKATPLALVKPIGQPAAAELRLPK